MSTKGKKLTSVNNAHSVSIGVGIIVRNAEKTIKDCIESFI